MIAVSVSFLLCVHVWILFLYFELIQPGSLIVLLYSSSMVLILTAFGRELSSSVGRFRTFNGEGFEEEEVWSEIAHGLEEAAYTLSPRDSKQPWPNLYIKRWKRIYLDRPVEYPLDRLAYLTAKYAPRAMDSCFLLKNSQLKRLVVKSDSVNHGQLVDEPHPSKVVNDGFQIYIQRRSAFYLERNIIYAGLKQFTRPGKKMKFGGIGRQELVAFQYSSPSSTDFDSRVPKSSGSSVERKANRSVEVIKMWKSLSRAFSR